LPRRNVRLALHRFVCRRSVLSEVSSGCVQ
jgi:hypothetical protein